MAGNRERKISRTSPASLTQRASCSFTESSSTSTSRRISRRLKLREEVTRRWLCLPAGSTAPSPRRRRSRAASVRRNAAALLAFCHRGRASWCLASYLVMKLLLDIQRITPALARLPGAVSSATPLPSATPTENIVAPRALPVESAPASRSPRHDRRPRRKRAVAFRRPNPKCAGPNRFIPRTSSRRTFATPPLAESCSNHADAENLSARHSGRPDRTGLQWLDRSFGSAARPFAAGT